MKLDKLFNPKNVAVIGASDKTGSVGRALIDNLLQSDYKGKVFPVNNKRKKIQGQIAYPNIKDIKAKVDLAIIAIPARFVLDAVKDCGESGVSGIVIISAGFQEIGKEGEILMQEIVKTAQKYNMRILGPNCLGFIRPDINLNASFASKMALEGNIAFVSQSGALCTSVLDWSIKNKVGFRYFVSIGSMADISFEDLVEYFSRDKKVNSILVYMESVKDAQKFIKAAKSFTKDRPMIVLKVGRSEAGSKAAKSHTGSLSGNDKVFDAAFERSGILRVDTVDSLFNSAKYLSMQKLPKGTRLAIVTNAGGPGVIATDAIEESLSTVAKLSNKSIESLNKFLPPAWSHGNPVDVLGDADSIRYKKSIEICLADSNVDAVLVILTPQAMTDPSLVADEITKMKNPQKKIIMASFMGGEDIEQGQQILENANIPVFLQPEGAINAYSDLLKHLKSSKEDHVMSQIAPKGYKPKTKQNKKIIAKVLSEGRNVLSEVESKKFLANYGIPVVKNAVAEKIGQVSGLTDKIGFPLVMKILSPDILHKIDVGGVVLNINSKNEAIKAFRDIMKSVKKKAPKANIHGIFMEKMIHKKYELLIGSNKDEIFGSTIVFGTGGSSVELYKDTKIALAPLDMKLSLKLMKKTKIFKMLKGFRGLPGVDIKELQLVLYKFSHLLTDFSEIKELDINPFAVDEKGGVVLDAKILLER